MKPPSPSRIFFLHLSVFLGKSVHRKRSSGSNVIKTDQQCLGFHTYKMDAKFRVSIPPAWRPEDETEKLVLLFSKEHELPVVKVLSQAAYGERVTRVKSSDMTPKEKDKMLGRLAMLSREVGLNDQGKILVAKDLSEKAGIAAEGDVVLVGRGSFFEFCSKESFETILRIESGEGDDDKLGIF